MKPLLNLALRQMVGGRRILLLILVALLPVGLAVLLKSLGGSGDQFERNFIATVVDAMMVGAVLPIVTVGLATAAFGNELEDRTLNVLVLKPVARWAIVLPKYLGSVIVAGSLLVVAGVAAAAIGLETPSARALLAYAAALAAGVVAYGALFTWLGLMTSHALGVALVYVFLWEGLVTTFLDGARYLSVRGYTLAILHGIDSNTFSSLGERVGSSRVDLQACKLEYSIVSPK